MNFDPSNIGEPSAKVSTKTIFPPYQSKIAITTIPINSLIGEERLFLRPILFVN